MESDGQIDSMLTVKEVARLLHVHPNTLRRWSKNGRIRAYRIAPRGDRRFKREEIVRFLAELNASADNWAGVEEQTAVTVDNITITLPEDESISGSRNSRTWEPHNNR